MTILRRCTKCYFRKFELFKFKVKVTGKILKNGNTKNVKTAVLLKHLRNIWRTLERLLINCQINFHLPWSMDETS